MKIKICTGWKICVNFNSDWGSREGLERGRYFVCRYEENTVIHVPLKCSEVKRRRGQLFLSFKWLCNGDGVACMTIMMDTDTTDLIRLVKFRRKV